MPEHPGDRIGQKSPPDYSSGPCLAELDCVTYLSGRNPYGVPQPDGSGRLQSIVVEPFRLDPE